MAIPRVPKPFRKGTFCRFCFFAQCVAAIVTRDLSEAGWSWCRGTGDPTRDMLLPEQAGLDLLLHKGFP